MFPPNSDADHLYLYCSLTVQRTHKNRRLHQRSLLPYVVCSCPCFFSPRRIQSDSHSSFGLSTLLWRAWTSSSFPAISSASDPEQRKTESKMFAKQTRNISDYTCRIEYIYIYIIYIYIIFVWKLWKWLVICEHKISVKGPAHRQLRWRTIIRFFK